MLANWFWLLLAHILWCPSCEICWRDSCVFTRYRYNWFPSSKFHVSYFFVLFIDKKKNKPDPIVFLVYHSQLASLHIYFVRKFHLSGILFRLLFPIKSSKSSFIAIWWLCRHLFFLSFVNCHADYRLINDLLPERNIRKNHHG